MLLRQAFEAVPGEHLVGSASMVVGVK